MNSQRRTSGAQQACCTLVQHSVQPTGDDGHLMKITSCLQSSVHSWAVCRVNHSTPASRGTLQLTWTVRVLTMVYTFHVDSDTSAIPVVPLKAENFMRTFDRIQ